MYILGISCYYHDAAACLLQDGKLVAAAAEERFTRVKATAEFPLQAIQFCLKQAGIAAGDLDYVVFYEKPLRRYERVLLSSLQEVPRSLRSFSESTIEWIKEKAWIKTHIQRALKIPAERITFVEHHLSHAASAFYCSPFQNAAVLTADGVGEWTTTALGVGSGTDLHLTQEIQFPHSLGLLYGAFTAHLGFAVNEGEYKVMGLAAYGRPRYVDEIYRLIEVAADGSFRLKPEYFSFTYSTRGMVTSRFIDQFGPPRPPGDENITEHHSDLAASIQKVTEEILLQMARHLHRQTGLDALCMAGGVALNSVANYRLRKEGPFSAIYVQPAAGDAGGALGAALYLYHAVLKQERRLCLNRADWGQAWSDAEIIPCLRREGVAFRQVADPTALVDLVSDALAAGKVAGWMQGRFEWGPRALGQRSILADPRRTEMKEVVNRRIKFREPFRPFAPAVLAAHAPDLFDMDGTADDLPFRFMLYVTDVKGDSLPAITHVDGTARPQVVDPEANPLFHQLLEGFYAKTGAPAVLNTSFNRRGEPIVASPADALRTFMGTDLDLLVMGNCVIAR